MTSETNLGALQGQAGTGAAAKIVFPILLSIRVCHLLNDTLQSLIPTIYPLLKEALRLNLGQGGVITFTSQFTASILQPLVGIYTYRLPQPYSFAIPLGVTLLVLLFFATAPSFGPVLPSVTVFGID